MKSRLSIIVFLLSVFFLVLSGCSSTTPSTTTTQPNAQTASTQTSAQTQQESQQEAKSPISLIETKVTRVVDGDTIHASVNGKDESIRLIGVDTPETVKPNTPVQPYGPEASAFSKAQLTDKTVWLEKDVQERDKYGRLLAYVWTEQPTEISDTEIRAKMFNAKLLLDGYGQLLTIAPDVKYVDYFTHYQTDAREGSKGLWGIPIAPAVSSAATSNEPATQSITSTPPPQVEKKGTTVYVTKTGHKYHRAGCKYLARSQIPMDLPSAIAAGYTPCSVCNP